MPVQNGFDQSSFAWPVIASYDGFVTLTPAELATLIKGIDWGAPEACLEACARRLKSVRRMLRKAWNP